MITELREEFARSAVNLFFPGDGLGHVNASLSDALEVWKQPAKLKFKKVGWNQPTYLIAASVDA
jgi:hypothetical protein